MRKLLFVPLAAVLTISAAQGAGPAPGLGMLPLPVSRSAPSPDTLALLTYNVHGLPWPAASDRSADLAAIGATLQSLRLRGAAPQVVVLQEAFTADARAIAARSGYRYVTQGPAQRADTLFDSGLMLLSDYPLSAVRRMAFAADACAGFDCLAAKGVLLAAITLPDGQVVDVATAHLNSRHASGVSDARADAAWSRQWAALLHFIDASRTAAAPLIVAGDFNVGHSAPRRAALNAALSGASGGGYISALRQITHATASRSASLDAVLRRGKDWTLSRAGRTRQPVPVSAAATFGADAAGGMRSDHIGYTVTYRIAAGHQL